MCAQYISQTRGSDKKYLSDKITNMYVYSVCVCVCVHVRTEEIVTVSVLFPYLQQMTGGASIAFVILIC